MVDGFIDDASEVRAENLSVAGRNENEVNLRFCMGTQLVPGLLLVLALLLEPRLRSVRFLLARVDSAFSLFASR